jgi:uncharacterized protein
MNESMMNKIITIITGQIPSALAIYIFGSHATDTNLSQSDVDIAFFTPFESKISPIEIHRIKMQLEVALGKDVDLVHLNTATTVFQFEITTTAKQLYVSDAEVVLKYEALVLSMYQRLQEERKDILDEIISSGKVYA